MLGSNKLTARRARTSTGSAARVEKAGDNPDLVIPSKFATTRHNSPSYCPTGLRGNDSSHPGPVPEVKGFQTEPDRAKETAAQRWVKAVNHHGGFGTWDLAVCKDPHTVGTLLGHRSAAAVTARA